MYHGNSFVNWLRSSINNFSWLSFSDRKELEEKLEYLAEEQVNILIVGGTGVGKSSTINALFQSNGRHLNSDEEAIVGKGPDPETQTISSYALDNLIIWDSPGLGESVQKDLLHIRSINAKLMEKTKDNRYLIDLVLVLLDAGSRDYDSTFRVLQTVKIRIPSLERIVVGLNQIDMVEKGYGWDKIKNCPTPELQKSIDIKIASVKRRLFDSIGLNADPVAFCAGFQNEWETREPFQVSELLCQIISAIPAEKRIAVLEKTKPEVLKKATKKQKEKIKKKTNESFGGLLLRGAAAVLTGGLLGGCFITTAVCEHLGKKDDCHMLTTFRRFRDGWLRQQPDGDALISEYYAVAPSIVHWIAEQSNSEEIYNYLLLKYLKPCYKAIQHGEFRKAKKLYVTMVQELIKQKRDGINV